MKLNIVPGIEKRSMYFRYFKIDSILELYAEQNIIICLYFLYDMWCISTIHNDFFISLRFMYESLYVL